MKKYIYFTIILLTIIPSCFSQRHIKSNEDGSAYVPLRLYESVYKRHITKKDYDKLKINGQDTLILVEDFEKFKNKMSRSSNFKSESRTYMTLKSFKEHYKRPLTKADSLTFKFNKNDTLVLVKGYKLKGVSLPYEEVDSTLLEIYKDVVYRKYSNNKSDRKLTMRYWKDEIKIYFSRTVNKKIRKGLKDFVLELDNEIDSLKISFVDDLEKSNYVIYAMNSKDDYKYEKRIKTKNIDYFLFWNGNQQIYDCKMEINTNYFDNEQEIIDYAKNIFVNSLGNFSRTKLIPKENFFSYYTSLNKKFTETDLKLLKYHYSYGICKGTNLEKFEDQHKRAKESLKKGNKHAFIHQE